MQYIIWPWTYLFRRLIHYVLLISRQGKVRLAKWYSPYSQKERNSKTLKEEKREELFESLKIDEKIGLAADVIDPRELSSKMLQKSKINLNEISHESAMGLVKKVLDLGYLLTEAYYILDEVLMARELQESSKKTVAHLVVAQDSISNIIARATKGLRIMKIMMRLEMILVEDWKEDNNAS